MSANKRARDDSDNESVPEDVLDLVSQKSNSKVAKKQRILNEQVVDQDVVDAMIDVTNHSDLRKVLNIEDGLKIQVKWYLEYKDDDEDETGYYWCDAIVTKKDTGKQHKFVDEDDENEFTYAPIVEIKYLDQMTNEDDKNDVKEICFISSHMIYDAEVDSVLIWRKDGDDYDEEDDSDEEDENEDDVFFVFSDISELEKEVNEFVPKIFVNVLQNFKTQYDNASFLEQREWDAHILMMKDLLVKKIIAFFKKEATEKPGAVLTLGKEVRDAIFDECLADLENI